MGPTDNSNIVEAIDAAVARLLEQVESLRSARAILAGLGVPTAVARPAQPLSSAVEKQQSQTSRGRTAEQAEQPRASRKRGRRGATLEFHSQLRKLLGEGVFDVRAMATRLGRSVQSIYQAMSEQGLSLRESRKQWQASRGVVERGPDPVSPPRGERLSRPDWVARLDFGDVVFVRHGRPGSNPTYVRCLVVSLPGESGEFTVAGPDGVEISLEVGDAVTPFRDGSPTFGVAAVEGGEEPGGSSDADPEGEDEPEIVSRAPSTPDREEVASSPGPSSPGTFGDLVRDARAATVPELRAEVVRRQRGCSGKAAQFATTLAEGHAHAASVDRMGYGTTAKDATGHSHVVMRWEVRPARDVAGHATAHQLTQAQPAQAQGMKT